MKRSSHSSPTSSSSSSSYYSSSASSATPSPQRPKGIFSSNKSKKENEEYMSLKSPPKPREINALDAPTRKYRSAQAGYEKGKKHEKDTVLAEEERYPVHQTSSRDDKYKRRLDGENPNARGVNRTSMRQTTNLNSRHLHDSKDRDRDISPYHRSHHYQRDDLAIEQASKKQRWASSKPYHREEAHHTLQGRNVEAYKQRDGRYRAPSFPSKRPERLSSPISPPNSTLYGRRNTSNANYRSRSSHSSSSTSSGDAGRKHKAPKGQRTNHKRVLSGEKDTESRGMGKSKTTDTLELFSDQNGEASSFKAENTVSLQNKDPKEVQPRLKLLQNATTVPPINPVALKAHIEYGAPNKVDKKNAQETADGASNTDAKPLSLANTLGRTGGVYIPPFKLARLQKEITDKTSVAYQRQTWDALRRSINGLVNKVNVNNIVNLVQELFRENIIRGRGVVARAIIRAQMASPGFTHIYAALLAIINTKFPEIGELVIHRVILQFRRAYRRNDKIVCLACVKFIAHLVNQRVVHELIALQLAALLLEKATDDSIEVAVGFIQEVGQMLNEVSKRGFDAIFERLRAILQEGESERKTQYTIEKLWDLRRTNFKDYPAVIAELDLVDEDDQITHEVDLLDESVKGEEMLNVFKAKSPEEYEEDERKWSYLSKEILGVDASESEHSVASSSDSEEEDASDGEMEETNTEQTTQITDYTEQDSINLRKAIYLTIMSSVNFEECVHKLLKLNIKAGQEKEVCTMLIDCCAMERTFQRYYALQAERFAKLQSVYADCLAGCFKQQYTTVHRLETNNLRNTAKFFAHLLYSGALPWTLLDTFVLTEGTTTSSGRIFIKIIFQELSEHLGLSKLNEKLHDPALLPYLKGIFPSDNPENVRFAINFFTAIGLGGLTDDLREVLVEAQQRYLRRSRSSSSRSSSERSSSAASSNSSSSSDD